VSEPSGPDPTPNVTIPGYEIIGELGRGGLGAVYRARDLTLDHDVAIKVLTAHFPADSPAALRFLDEARITAQLQHPGIPPVHHAGTLPDGRPFIDMKLIKGCTLHDLLEDRPAARHDRARYLAVFAQVCHALAYAHSRLVIHRDVKPTNVMIGAFGEVYLMDWGLSRVMAEHEREPGPAEITPPLAPQPSERTIIGTPAHMSPELARGERGDTRCDVFGLGGILCFILTGEPPFPGPTAVDALKQAAGGDVGDAFARLDRCGADPELIALAKRCLAPNPAERPADAGEVARLVAPIGAQESALRHRRRVRLLVLLLLFLAVFTLGIAIGLGLK
jgi:eukaryotic-like serine/threonine-protein kinase